MKLPPSALSRLINFLLGVAWAFVLLGISYIFLSYYRFSLIDALLLSLLGSLPGLFIVTILEYILVGLRRNEEITKQTKLLEEILRLTKEQNKAV